MNKNFQIALAEVKYILKHLTTEEKNKIPVTLRQFITDNYDENHIVDVNNLSKRTYALLALIDRKYLSENKEELELEHQKNLEQEMLKNKKLKAIVSNNKK